MLERLAHRGPDDQGWLAYGKNDARAGKSAPPDLHGEVFLFHRRLSILDLSEAGHQPMRSPCGRWWLVFNGEIYNYLELREELRALGHEFHTGTDSEVLIQAFARWGKDALARLVGMFAFALLDTRERRLTVARDGFGIKPLYWTSWRGGIAFASEQKALLALPGFTPRADPQALLDFLRFGSSDQSSQAFMAGVQQLLPGQVAEIDLAGKRDGWSRTGFHWRPSIGDELDISFADAAERLRELFVDSVRLHLRSDVPVGAALSGGVDSSAIVCAIRRIAPGQELHTFTYSAEEAEVDEIQWANRAAKHACAIPHVTRPASSDLIRDLPALARAQDAPFGSMSIYAQHSVFRLAREHGIKVMLDGQGADELLGGYAFYSAARAASLIRKGRWAECARFLRNAARMPGRGRLPLVLGSFLLPPVVQGPFRFVVGEPLWPAWIRRDWFEREGVSPHAHHARSRSSDVLKHELHTTLTETTLPMLLRFEDRNSMAFSLESRVPFLTQPMADFILQLPESYLIDGMGNTKAVFRSAMRGIVPDEILDRKDKIGFQAPGEPWVKELAPWIEQMLRSDALRGAPFLTHKKLLRHWELIRDGKIRLDSTVWRWISLAAWASSIEGFEW
jgi:asparagine synthase (glutamine-hydrolysing)